MRQSTQGGSVRKFIVVAIVLAALVAAGVYFIRQQTLQPEPIPEEGSMPAEEQAPPEEVKEPEVQPVAELPGEAVTEQLPATGPAESLSALLVIGAVSLMAVYYVRSRRPELSL